MYGIGVPAMVAAILYLLFMILLCNMIWGLSVCNYHSSLLLNIGSVEYLEIMDF